MGSIVREKSAPFSVLGIHTLPAAALQESRRSVMRVALASVAAAALIAAQVPATYAADVRIVP